MKNLFLYGTLMCDELRACFISQPHRIEAASLNGFQRFKVKQAPYPAILPAEDAVVSGLLAFDIADQSIELLDEYEGEYYARGEVSVVAANQKYYAQTYVFRPEYYHLLEDYDWSMQEFVNHSLTEYLSIFGQR